MKPLQKLIHDRNFPIYVILLAGLILGLFIFRDFGPSWDEPDYYRYASRTMHAYSITDLMNGSYDLKFAMGDTDLRYYGPAYLVICAGIHTFLASIFKSANFYDIWHLINYLTFLLGVFFFYKLAQRWVSKLAAALSALIFASQPILFGTTWFDPKDIPFMVFFMGAIYFGFLFSDHFKRVLAETPLKREGLSEPEHKPGKAKRRPIALIAGNLFIFILSLILLVERKPVYQYTIKSIGYQNQYNPDGLINRNFLILASYIDGFTLKNYMNLICAMEKYLLLVLLIFSILILAFSLIKPEYLDFRESFQSIKAGYRNYPHKTYFWLSILGASVFTGLDSATRILGLFAGVLILFIWLFQFKRDAPIFILFYGLISFLICYLFWPFLWQAPITKFLYVIHRTMDFPDVHQQLFAGIIYDSTALPRLYLPTLFVKTFTESAILLSLLGLIFLIYHGIKNRSNRLELLLLLIWFFIPFGYAILKHPPLYDNYRQVLFILPPVFLFTAFSLDILFKKVTARYIQLLLAAIVLFPGILGIITLHPYEYSYYNMASGGIKKAAYNYEVDYWLTCYRGLAEKIDENEKSPIDVYVAYIPEQIKIFSNKNINVHKIEEGNFTPGSLLILPLRWDTIKQYPDYPIQYSIQRDGVDLCAARKVN